MHLLTYTLFVTLVRYHHHNFFENLSFCISIFWNMFWNYACITILSLRWVKPLIWSKWLSIKLSEHYVNYIMILFQIVPAMFGLAIWLECNYELITVIIFLLLVLIINSVFCLLAIHVFFIHTSPLMLPYNIWYYIYFMGHPFKFSKVLTFSMSQAYVIAIIIVRCLIYGVLAYCGLYSVIRPIYPKW